MGKERPDYYAEIDRICDLAAARENTRLQNGGAGVGDLAEGVEYEGQHYIMREPIEELPSSRLSVAEVVDNPNLSRMPVTDQADMHKRLGEIRGRVMSYPENVRLDIGYLLTVIDAYESGRL
jgi:hypothetical protein